MRLYRWCGLVALTAGLAAAADAPVPGPFRAFIAVDERYDKGNTRNRAGRMHDLVTDAGLNPTVAVFARQVPQAADAPLARLAVQLEKLVAAHRADRLGAFVLFLTLEKEYPEADKRAEKADELRKLAAQLKTGGVPFGLAAAKGPGADAWKLADGAEVTVVFFHKMGVVKRWEFTADKPLTDEEAKQVEAAVAAELKK